MARVLDASVIMRWLVDEPLSANARALLTSDEALLAPVLARSEVANALWRQVASGRLTLAEAIDRMAALAESDIEFVDDVSLQLGALHVAATAMHPVYDGEYLALALDRDADLVTADDRLWQLAQSVLGSGAVRLADVPV